MAVTDAYASAAEYRAATGKSDTSDDAQILLHLTTVSRFLEREMGTFFTLDASDVERTFYGEGDSVLRLNVGGCPGIGDSSGLVLKVDEDDDRDFSGETAFTNSNLVLLPLNHDKGPLARPITKIQLTQDSRLTWFPKNRLVSVTAKWGWPSVPQPIKDLTIEVTSIWRAESPRSTGRMNELQQVVSASPLAMSLVKKIENAFRDIPVA